MQALFELESKKLFQESIVRCNSSSGQRILSPIQNSGLIAKKEKSVRCLLSTE